MSTPLKSHSRIAQEQDCKVYTTSPVMPRCRNVLHSNAPPLPSQPMGNVRPAVPPLPQRPPHLASISNRSTYGMAPSMYGGYSGFGGYSSYGTYPGNMYMSGGGYGYGSYGQPYNNFENRLLQAAEERSRGAFQSIESLVRAFSSVSMMLESTYHAMHSSFRAILGVVDNFSRLRQMFAQFFSAIAILRIIQNFYRRLLHWFGVIDHIPQSEQIWNSAVTGNTNDQVATYSSWPLFTFIGLLFGGPYLISKFFSSNIVDSNKWDPQTGTFCTAVYPHVAASQAELSFSKNEVLNIAPTELQLEQNNGWVLASNLQGKTGYAPVTRLVVSQGHQSRGNFVNNPTSMDPPVEPQG